MLIIIIQFIICTALIIFFSDAASKYGCAVAKNKKWHEGFVGVVFLAFATSLPEVCTSLSSVPEIFGISKINLGAGDALGSLIINLTILSVLDLIFTRGKLLKKAATVNISTGAYTIILLITFIFFSYVRHKSLQGLSILNIGIESIMIIAMYFTGMHIIFKERHDKTPEMLTDIPEKPDHLFLKFSVSLVFIFLLGIWLSTLGSTLTVRTNISHSFIGSFVLAFATSLPELAVCVAAIRIGSINMAVGNILGSNFFDVCIIPLMDIVYRRAIITADLKPINSFMAFSCILLTLILMAGIFLSNKNKKANMVFVPVSILIIGTACYYYIYIS